MQVNKTDQASFKGAYTLKGCPEILDEVCWYLGRVKKRTEKTFDFLDIRSAKSLNPIENAFYVDRTQKGLVVTRGKNFQDKKDTVFDLFITGKDKKLVEPITRNMIEDSVGLVKNNVTMAEKIKILLSNLNEMSENLSKGKPISNVNFLVLKSYMSNLLNMHNLREIKAEDAYNGLRTDTFDIVEGIFK